MKIPFSYCALLGLLALLMVLTVSSQTDDHVITFSFDTTIQAGAKTSFNFTSTKDFLAKDRIVARWQNDDAEPSRDTNCLLVHRQTNYPNQLRQGLNFGHMFCYLPTQTQHFTDILPDDVKNALTPGELWVAEMENNGNQSPDNCNGNTTEDPKPVFAIAFTVDVPAGTQITCDFASASTNILPPRSDIVPLLKKDGTPKDGIKWSSAAPVSVTIVPTKAWVMSSRPHPTDPFAYLVTMNSTRTGLVEMSTIVNTFAKAQRTQFGFVNHHYSSGTKGSFWCPGAEKSRRKDRIARVVPPEDSRRMMVANIGIYFEEANVAAECTFRLQPLQMGVQMTDPRVYFRLHQQPLHYAFNVTHDHFKFNVSNTFLRLTNGYNTATNKHRDLKSYNPALALINNSGSADQTSIVPRAVVQFPIQPGYAKGSLFFLKLTALEGTIIQPEAFLQSVDLAIDLGLNADITPSVSVDTSDETRIKITYNGDVSGSLQLMGVSITLRQPALEPTRYRYQVDVMDSDGTLLNIYPEDKIEIDMISQMQIHTATYSLQPTQMDVTVTFAPNWNSVGPGSLVKIASRAGNWFNGTETCTAERANGDKLDVKTIKKKGDVFVTINNELIQKEIITTKCAITSPTAFLWDLANTNTKEERYIILEVGVIPPRFTLPIDYHNNGNAVILAFYDQYNRFAVWPGSVILDKRDTVVTIVAPPDTTPATMLLEEEDNIFDPLQDTTTPPPTKEDPQGWTFNDWGYTISSAFPWSPTSTIQDLKPYVERVAKVLATVKDSKGNLPYSNISFDNLYYQAWSDWGNRRVPHVEVLGTVASTQSPYEYTVNNYIISWAFARPEGTEELIDAMETAVKTAVEDGTISKTDAWFDSRYINGTPISESCKGSQAFGRPTCVLKLPNMKCNNNSECNSYICNDDKVCATVSRTYAWHQWTRPESLGQFSPEQFSYLTANTISHSVIGAFVMFIVAMMF